MHFVHLINGWRQLEPTPRLFVQCFCRSFDTLISTLIPLQNGPSVCKCNRAVIAGAWSVDTCSREGEVGLCIIVIILLLRWRGIENHLDKMRTHDRSTRARRSVRGEDGVTTTLSLSRQCLLGAAHDDAFNLSLILRTASAERDGDVRMTTIVVFVVFFLLLVAFLLCYYLFPQPYTCISVLFLSYPSSRPVRPVVTPCPMADAPALAVDFSCVKHF